MRLPSGSALLSGKTSAFAAVCACTVAAQLDTSVVNLATHAISGSFSASFAALQWVLVGYNLAYASLLLFGGGLVDLVGHRRVFMWGAAVFSAGTLGAGAPLSPDGFWRSMLVGASTQAAAACLLLAGAVGRIPRPPGV